MLSKKVLLTFSEKKKKKSEKQIGNSIACLLLVLLATEWFASLKYLRFSDTFFFLCYHYISSYTKNTFFFRFEL